MSDDQEIRYVPISRMHRNDLHCHTMTRARNPDGSSFLDEIVAAWDAAPSPRPDIDEAVDRMAATNARLREALETLRKWCDCSELCSCSSRMGAFAFQALGHERKDEPVERSRAPRDFEETMYWELGFDIISPSGRQYHCRRRLTKPAVRELKGKAFEIEATRALADTLSVVGFDGEDES